MKIWNGYASEHSSNLVMIGQFKEVRDAAEAEALIKILEDMVQGDRDSYEFDLDPKDRRYNQEMLELLLQLNFFPSPVDLTQLLLDVDVRRDRKTIIVTTDEIDVSIFMKALIHHGARVEIYSRHNYPDTEDAS